MRLLCLKDLNRLGSSVDPEKIWVDLGLLVSRLEDHLVVVEEVQGFGGGPCHLTHFEVSGEPLYVLVGNDGAVRLGRADRLAESSEVVIRQLDGFDALEHGVVSVAVTARHRFVGERLDLWVIVRRPGHASQEGVESVAYHGLVSVEDGKPRLEPSLDDGGESGARRWEARPIHERFPQWLREWRFITPFPCDPFDKLPDSALHEIQKIDTDPREQVEVVAWSPGTLAIAVAGEVRFSRHPGPGSEKLSLGEWTRALASTGEPPGSARGVAGPDARLLVAFQEEWGSWRVAWRQPVHDFPVALAFLPAAETESWPDLLAAYHDGIVQRLRYVGNERIREAWSAAWKRLDLDRAEQRIDVCKSLTAKEPVARRQAALVGALEAVLEEAPRLALAEREAWLDRVSTLFQPEESFRVLRDALDILLWKLESLLDGNREPLPVPGYCDFFAALVHRIYTGQSYIALQDRSDQFFRLRKLPAVFKQDPSLKELEYRSSRNREFMWNHGSPLEDEDPVKHSVFGLERWANAYLPADTLHLNPKDVVVAGLAGSMIQGRQGWVVVASSEELSVHGLRKNGMLEVGRGGRRELKNDAIRAILQVSISPEGPLVVAGASGTLHLFNLDPKNGNLRPLRKLEVKELGSPWALASTVWQGQTVLAVAYNDRRRSFVLLCGLDGNRLREMSRIPLHLPRVRALDLSADRSGLLIAAGSVQAAPVGLYRLDEQGTISDQRWFRVLKSGTLSLRFSAAQDPQTLLAGERSGLLWCADLAARSEVSDLRWTYDLGGAVRSIESVNVDGEAHFLVGSEHRRLALLHGWDGRRVWKHRLRESVRLIRRIGETGGHRVAIAMSSGWISIFSHVEDQPSAFGTVESVLVQLKGDEASLQSSTAEPVHALYHLITRPGASPVEVVRRYPVRDTRARVVRYLAHHLQADLETVLSELTFRDLMLLLSYLPDSMESLDLKIWETLGKDRPRYSGDNSRRARMAAMVTFLQRLGRRGGDPALLEASGLLSDSQDRTWVRLEYTRILLQHISRQAGGDENSHLLARALPHLLRLPPALAKACGDVLRYGSEAEKEFSLFRSLVGDLERALPARADEAASVAEVLRAYETEGAVVLLAQIADLFALCLELEDEEWTTWRKDALQKIRSLLPRLRGLEGAAPVILQLAEELRLFLLDELPPEDQAPLKQREKWLQQALRRLEAPPNRALETRAETPWEPILHQLVSATRKAVTSLLQKENRHILALVRPFLHLREIELDESRRATLRFHLRPEGNRQLRDVTILIDADDENGLLRPGKTFQRLTIPQYPGKSSGQDLELSGFVSPGQGEFVVRVTLQAEDYRTEDRWHFKLPRRQAPTPGRLAFPTDLPQTFRRFVQSAAETKASAAFVVLDEDFSRNAFVEHWLQWTGGRQIDLDVKLRPFGPGRHYSARALDIELLEETYGEYAGDETAGPLLICPADEVLERLISGEAPGLLENWIVKLRLRTAKGIQPRLAIVVSSSHACYLRTLALGSIPEVAAHRFLLESAETAVLGSSPLQAELQVLVQKEAGIGLDDARSRLERLGWDLRLAFRWLRWLKEGSGREGRIHDFLAERQNEELLQRELRSLESFDLINAFLGAEAVAVLSRTRAEPGHFAAEDHYSTTRTRQSASKLLVRRSEPFTVRSLQSLESDLAPPDQVRVQGVGLIGTPEASRSRLLVLADQTPKERREASFRRLATLGIGTFLRQVFRTGSPYRELIQGLYDKAVEKRVPRPDSWVYSELVGQDRSPLESLSLLELSHVRLDGLRTLLPDANPDDLRRLQRIGLLWAGEPGEEVGSVLAAVFKPESVRLLDRGAARWDAPLTLLPWPVYGIGAWGGKGSQVGYPADYVIWCATHEKVDLKKIGDAADEAAHRRQKEAVQHSGEEHAPYRYPRILLLGPGADSLGKDQTRRVAVLTSSHLRQAAWEGKLVERLRRLARAQLRMTALSPFQASGALSPGSPLFVGRENELAYIQARARNASILIVGSRRVGKTSLLNQIYHWAQGEADLAPIFVDLQGCQEEVAFRQRLRDALDLSPYFKVQGRNLAAVANALRRSGKLPLLLVNEVDGLVRHAPRLIESWRSLNDQQLVRFVMVGYSAIAHLGVPDHPLFHFTEGTDFGGKAVALRELSRPAAEKLLDLLETSDLQIQWTAASERELAYKLCLDRSYRIPWVLQRYGQILVEYLEKNRQTTLSYNDVESVIEGEGQVVWKYIEGIDYRSLGMDKSSNRPGFLLLLGAVARRRYFLEDGKAPIRDSGLSDRSPLDPQLGFTVGEARDIVKKTLAELLKELERPSVERWFDELDLDQALRLLTLTLMLEPDPKQEGRYGFLLHILPRELWRRYGKDDPTLDNLIIRNAVEFWSLMNDKVERRDV